MCRIRGDCRVFPYRTQTVCSRRDVGKTRSQLLRLEGNQKYMDEIEKYVYNGLIGAMKPDGRGFSYVNLLNGVKTNDHGWDWMFDSKHGGKLHVTCCNLNGPEGLAYIPYIAVMQDSQRNPVINFYNAATVNTETPKGRPLTIDIVTDFPKSGNVKVRVNVE
ncbi:MAG: glycoside hydrolase family 127 protein [Tannerella sp.]|nr:glycoside hydrolase family 127 protein [Tannerella sp.]